MKKATFNLSKIDIFGVTDHSIKQVHKRVSEMMKWIFVIVVFLVGCGGKTDQNTLKVACAANMHYAMDSIAALFKNQTGISCEITAGSSGMLATQIENGAPYHFFISADMDYPQAIYASGNGEKPFVYGSGRLIFVMPKNAPYKTIEEALMNTDLKRIGIADTRFAPYGKAADEFLRQTDFYNAVSSRLVVGESIGQINQYLTTGAVDAAFTNYAFQIENENDFTFLEVDSGSFNPILQGAMILKNGQEHQAEATQKLKNFLTSPVCKNVLTYFGYRTN